MKKLLFLIALYVPVLAAAQSYDDVVYLTNGSQIKGRIVEQVSGVSLTIVSNDGVKFVLRADEVGRFIKGDNKPAVNPSQRVSTAPKPVVNKRDGRRRKGWFNNLEYAEGTPYEDEAHFSLTMVNGYRFSPYIALGAGAGIMWDYAGTTMPVFAHFRWDMINRKATPYLTYSLGYCVALDDNDGWSSMDANGWLQEIGAGVAFDVGRKSRMSIGLGMLGHSYYENRDYDYYFDDYHQDVVSTLRLKLGFSF